MTLPRTLTSNSSWLVDKCGGPEPH
ncbi:unnamed protein product, partial [Didymodactylos carnosus]